MWKQARTSVVGFKLFTQVRHIGHTHTNNGFFKLVEALLQIHSCFFSHSVKLRGLPLSAVTVSLNYQPKLPAFRIHMRQTSATQGCHINFFKKGQTFSKKGQKRQKNCWKKPNTQLQKAKKDPNLSLDKAKFIKLFASSQLKSHKNTSCTLTAPPQSS